MLTPEEAQREHRRVEARRRVEELLDQEPPCDCDRVGDISYSADCDYHNYNSKWRRDLRAAEAEAE